jgi:hypothetical protein
MRVESDPGVSSRGADHTSEVLVHLLKRPGRGEKAKVAVGPYQHQRVTAYAKRCVRVTAGIDKALGVCAAACRNDAHRANRWRPARIRVFHAATVGVTECQQREVRPAENVEQSRRPARTVFARRVGCTISCVHSAV